MSIFREARAFHRDQSGQDLIEYTLVMTVIALGATAAMNLVAAGISDIFQKIGRKFVSEA